MKDATKEKIRLTTREILLSFYDGIVETKDIFAYPWQRKQIREYRKWRELDKANFYHKLWQLEKQGYIKRYGNLKKKNIKLTSVGRKKAVQYALKDWKIKTPKKWDKKWHLVIFDIPNDKKALRDTIRQRLNYWGFYQLQESVFVYPFDCRKEISAIKYIYGVGIYLEYIIAESIETELYLVDIFYERGILPKKLN